MSKDKYRELRDDLSAVARKLAAEQNGASVHEIVAAFRKQRPALVRAASDYLLKIALTRLAGDVIKRRGEKLAIIDQSELFGRQIKDIVAISSSGSGAGRRNRYHLFGSLPVGLAEKTVRHHIETRRRKKDRFDGYQEIVEFVRAHGASDDMTIDEALAAAYGKHVTGGSAAGGDGKS